MSTKIKSATGIRVAQALKPGTLENNGSTYKCYIWPLAEVTTRLEIEVIRKLEKWGIIPPLKQRNDIY